MSDEQVIAEQLPPVEVPATDGDGEAPNLSPDVPDHSDKPLTSAAFAKHIAKLAHQEREAEKQFKSSRAGYERQLMASTVVPLSDDLPTELWVKVRNAQVQGGLSQEELDYATPEVKREAKRMAQEEASARQEDKNQAEPDAAHETAYQERSRAFAETRQDFSQDDFNRVVGTIRMTESVAREVQAALLEHENGPAIAYHLGQHPELCAELSAMTPKEALSKLAESIAEPDTPTDAPPEPQIISTDKEHMEAHDKFRARLGAKFATDATVLQAANAIGEVGADANVIHFVTHVLADLDNGIEVFKMLGKNPSLLLTMGQMNPVDAGNLLTEISNDLHGNRPAAREQKSATNDAAKPITPVRRSSPTSTGLSDDLSPEEWLKRREAQIKARERR